MILIQVYEPETNKQVVFSNLSSYREYIKNNSPTTQTTTTVWEGIEITSHDFLVAESFNDISKHSRVALFYNGAWQKFLTIEAAVIEVTERGCLVAIVNALETF